MARHVPADVRRAQILAATMDVCGERGYHGARVDDIAARAGLSKGAIYHHFANKQALFLGLLDKLLADSVREMMALDAAGMSFRDTVHAATETMLALVHDRPEVMRGLCELYLVALRDPPFRDQLRRHYQQLVDAGEQLVRHGIARGELAAHVDPAATSRLFMLGGDGLMLMHLVLGDERAGIASARSFAQLILDAITASAVPPDAATKERPT